MKLRFLSLALAVVAPLAACSSNNSVAPNTIQSPTSKITPVSVTQNWYNYTAKDGSYTAKFPNKPTETNNSRKTEAGEINFLQAIYEDKAQRRIYITQSNKIPVPPDQFNPEKGLDGARNGQIKDGKTLLSEKKITLNGFPGREFTIQDKKGIVMKSRVFINSNEPAMYMALVGAENGKLDFPEAKGFLDALAVPK